MFFGLLFLFLMQFVLLFHLVVYGFHCIKLFLSESNISENSCVNFFQSGLFLGVKLKTIFGCAVKYSLD